MRGTVRADLFRREAVAVARQGKLMLAAVRRTKQARPIEAPRVVVFLHGYMAAGAVFDPLRRRVERDLALPTLDFTYGPLGDFSTTVDRLLAHLDEAVVKDAQLSLVGHSLGGLFARWYTQMHGSRRVDRVLTLATPHAGTESARFAPGSLGEALRPESDVIARLRDGHASVAHLPHFSLVAGRDRMCNPPESAAALDGAEIVRIDDLGHNELLFDDRVHRAVIRALR
jgi:triacylglycerol lipase